MFYCLPADRIQILYNALCVMDLLQMLFIMVGQYYYVYIQCHINYAGKERRTRSWVDQTVDHLFGAAMACSQIDDTTWVDHGRPSILDVLLPHRPHSDLVCIVLRVMAL